MADTIEIVQGTATVVEVAGPTGPQGPQGATGSGLGTLTTQGDTLYQGASAAQRLPIGTAGQILKVNAGATAPEWGAAPASGVSSVNGETGAVTLDAADVGAAWPLTLSYQVVTGNVLLSAGRNRRIGLETFGVTATVDLPYAANQNGDRLTLVADFRAATTLTIRAAAQMAGGVPITYSTLGTLTQSGQSLSFVSSGSNDWSLVAVDTHNHDSSYPSVSNAVQEYNVNSVLLPNGDSGSGVQLTRNTATPQTPDGSERTFNAEQLIYSRVGGTAQRLDTYLGVKLEWQPVAPTTKTSTGSTGQIAYADPYFYICVGVNTWRRIPVAAW
jgi:hypothetical protein